MTEKREFRDGERLRKKLLREERLRGGENQDKYIFGKSHFEDEERLRGIVRI
jgi:hypothetical protein